MWALEVWRTEHPCGRAAWTPGRPIWHSPSSLLPQVAAYNQAAQAHASPLLAIPRSNFYRLIKEMVDLCTLIHGGERRPYKIRQRVYTHRAHPGKEFKEVQVCALEDRPVYKITRRAFDVIQVPCVVWGCWVARLPGSEVDATSSAKAWKSGGGAGGGGGGQHGGGGGKGKGMSDSMGCGTW